MTLRVTTDKTMAIYSDNSPFVAPSGPSYLINEPMTGTAGEDWSPDYFSLYDGFAFDIVAGGVGVKQGTAEVATKYKFLTNVSNNEITFDYTFSSGQGSVRISSRGDQQSAGLGIYIQYNGSISAVQNNGNPGDADYYGGSMSGIAIGTHSYKITSNGGSMWVYVDDVLKARWDDLTATTSSQITLVGQRYNSSTPWGGVLSNFKVTQL